MAGDTPGWRGGDAMALRDAMDQLFQQAVVGWFGGDARRTGQPGPAPFPVNAYEEPRPSAPSGRIVGNGERGGDAEVRVVRAVEGGADALGQLLGGQQAGGLGDATLAVDPLGLD